VSHQCLAFFEKLDSQKSLLLKTVVTQLIRYAVYGRENLASASVKSHSEIGL
jgi:hypothetical protein